MERVYQVFTDLDKAETKGAGKLFRGNLLMYRMEGAGKLFGSQRFASQQTPLPGVIFLAR